MKKSCKSETTVGHKKQWQLLVAVSASLFRLGTKHVSGFSVGPAAMPWAQYPCCGPSSHTVHTAAMSECSQKTAGSPGASSGFWVDVLSLCPTPECGPSLPTHPSPGRARPGPRTPQPAYLTDSMPFLCDFTKKGILPFLVMSTRPPLSSRTP